MSELCDSCGGRMSLLNDFNPFHCKCGACGHETYYLADPSPSMPSSADIESVEVIIQWKNGRASADEIIALRQFVPELRDRPMAKICAAVHAASEWPLGRHARFLARGIQADAAKVGLTVVIKAVKVEP